MMFPTLFKQCTCPVSPEEVESHPDYDPNGWRHYHLVNKARTTEHELHYPSCPFFQTREERDRAEMERILKILDWPLTDRD